MCIRDSTNFTEIATILKDLVLDADANPVMTDGMVLPSKVLVATFTKMVSVLGK